MKKYLIPIVLLVTSCTPSFDYDAMAVEMCNCLQPMADISVQIEAASNSSDTLLFRRVLEKIELVAAKSDSCANQLYEKYGDIAPENEAKAQEALMKACPEIMNKMSK